MQIQKDCTLHIDMSGRFQQDMDVGIAWVVEDRVRQHKGLALSARLIKDCEEKLSADQDYPRLHAICIYTLLQDIIQYPEKIVICNDEPFHRVKHYLDILFNNSQTTILSLAQYKERTGEEMKSPAHGRANSYRKRGLQPRRHDRGTALNVVTLTLKQIKQRWKFIEEKKRWVVAWPTI